MLLQRWTYLWNTFWFPETTTIYLAICRIIAVAAQLWFFFPPIERNIELLERSAGFIDPQLFIVAIAAIVPSDVFFTPDVFAVVCWVTIITGLMAIIGLVTRLSLLVFTLGNWFFIAHRYSYADIHHPESIFCIFLLLLVFAPSGEHFALDTLLWPRRLNNHERLSRDRVTTAVWPLQLAFVLLSWAYFSTGISKLIYGGFAWMNGYTLQDIILDDAIQRNIPLGIWVAQQYMLCVLLSVFTVAFELFFFLSLFIHFIRPYFLVGGILFQIGLYIVAGHPFFQHILLLVLLLPFINFARWDSWLNKMMISFSATMNRTRVA